MSRSAPGDSASGSAHAVLLIDMGGPQSSDEVRPYLQRIFFDPFIIPGNPVKRWLLSRLIAHKSAAETQKRYEAIGGKSNAVPDAQILGRQLVEFFSNRGIELTVEVATRYSNPDIPQGLQQLLNQRRASEALACPITAVYLFPHQTDALTGSCEAVLQKAAQQQAVSIAHHVRQLSRTQAYLDGWTRAIQDRILDPEKTCVLFTAHSLPNALIERGDPYVDEVEWSVEQIKKRLTPNVTTELAYQSQEGKNWLGPRAEEKAAEARKRGMSNLLVAPLSFVGDNTETLLDIDQELMQAIEPLGFDRMERVPPPNQTGFLCEMVAEALCQEWNVAAD